MTSQSFRDAVNHAKKGNGFFDTWLDGDWSESKYHQYLVMGILPITKPFLDYSVGKKKNQMYMNRYGLDYSDLYQPWNLPGSNEMRSGVSGVVNFTSSNISRLYR